MTETLRPIPTESVIRVGNYDAMDVVHGVRLDRAAERMQQVEHILGQLAPGQNKSVEYPISIPTENGEEKTTLYITPALHRAVTNRVDNERRALYNKGQGSLADEILTARTGVVFEAKETPKDRVAKTGDY